MALGRQEFSATKVLLIGDSAIGPHADWAEFRKDWDAKHLDMVKGEQPTWFVIEQLTEDQKRILSARGYGRLDSTSSPIVPDHDDASLIIRCFLRSWENYQVQTVGGTHAVEPPSSSDFEDAGKLGRVLKDDAMRRLKLTIHQWRWLYMLGFYFSEPALPLSKPSVQPHGQSSQ